MRGANRRHSRRLGLGVAAGGLDDPPRQRGIVGFENWHRPSIDTAVRNRKCLSHAEDV